MKPHNRLFTRPSILPLAAVALIAAHVIFFNRLWHVGASIAVISGLAILVIAKHIGVFGSLYALFRRGSRK